MAIINKLVGKFEIFDEEDIEIRDSHSIYGYLSREEYTDIQITLFKQFKKRFEYISFAHINGYGYDPDNLGELDERINSSNIMVSISNIDHFKAELNFALTLNGVGYDFDIMNEHDLIIKLSILGKKIGSRLPLWKELLYSFYYLYENKNYRADFVQLYSAFESYLEYKGANPNDQVKHKLISVIGDLSSKSKKYRDSFYDLKDIRNTLAHGSYFNLCEDEVQDLFNFFEDTYDMK